MYKVSDLLGKPLLALSEAQILGTIANICFDDKMNKGTFVMFYTGEEEPRYLPLSKLLNFESDAAVVKCADGIVQSVDGLLNPINSYAFSQNGKSLGIVNDIVMDGTKVDAFIVDGRTLSSSDLISAGKLLVFCDGEKPIKLKLPTKKAEAEPKKEIRTPRKVGFAPSYDFLLGKKLQRTILSVDGKIIAREGDNVTGSIIENAKREGKLVILALNAL